MQTETLFRAARALEVIGNAIRTTAPELQFSFHGRNGELYVALTGLPLGDEPGDNNLLGKALEINDRVDAYATSEDYFVLNFASGGPAGGMFRVDAA